MPCLGDDVIKDPEKEVDKKEEGEDEGGTSFVLQIKSKVRLFFIIKKQQFLLLLSHNRRNDPWLQAFGKNAPVLQLLSDVHM